MAHWLQASLSSFRSISVNAKLILDNYITEEGYDVLGQAISSGYLACDSFISDSPALSGYYPGMTHRGHLLNIFCMHALDQAAARTKLFYGGVAPNAARNHFHARFQFGLLTITSHFSGRRADRQARKAVNLALLAAANGDLFENEAKQPDVVPDSFADPLWCRLYHGGWTKPLAAVLVIPNRDQTESKLSLALRLPEPSVTEAEAVTEMFKMSVKTNSVKENESSSAAS